MSRCTGRQCIPSSKHKIPEDPEGPFRYEGQQCPKVCEPGSSLCSVCEKKMAKYISGEDKTLWHGFHEGELPEESHIAGSAWNLKLRAKYAAKMASAVLSSSNAAPEVKKAAKKSVKKALSAVAEATEAHEEAVSMLKQAEKATTAVIRKSSSSPAKKAVLLGMAEMRFGSSSSPKKTARKSRASASAAATMLGMAEMRFGSSSSPKKTARKPKTERKKKSPKPKTERKPRTSAARRKTAKKSPNMMIYRPASASGSPLGGKNYAGYATPYSGSPASSSSSQGFINTGHANQAVSPNSSSNSGSGSENLTLY